MIYSTYIGNLRNIPPHFEVIRIAYPSVLGPDKKLLWDYKDGRINWQQYVQIFKWQIIHNDKAQAELTRVKNLGERTDIVLYCYENLRKPGSRCHRTLVMKMLEDMGAQVGGEYPQGGITNYVT